MAEYDREKYNVPSDIADNGKLNKLRAAVLGANDGVVSTSSVIMGVAGATSEQHPIIIAGVAALVAGALSMAVGEFVSVSSQADAEKTYIEEEKNDLQTMPKEELDELTREYVKLGVSEKTAQQVAKELTAKDPLRAHLQVHFNLNPDDINSPVQAAVASLVAFTAGGLVPFASVALMPQSFRIAGVVTASLAALFATGYLSATVSKSSKRRAIVRVILGGATAMAVTFCVGQVFGVAVG